MIRIGVFIIFLFKIIYVENRSLPSVFEEKRNIAAQDTDKLQYDDDEEEDEKIKEFPYHKVMGFTEGPEHKYQDEPGLDNKSVDGKPKPCSVVVLSNIQNPTVQSLLRKYRYDAQGILIPGSVKYYIKVPQGYGSQPILVPLKDKAFTPLGGFVRYYKEVPPIPQTW